MGAVGCLSREGARPAALRKPRHPAILKLRQPHLGAAPIPTRCWGPGSFAGTLFCFPDGVAFRSWDRSRGHMPHTEEQHNAYHRHREVVQRRQGLRLHHAGGRPEGLLRPPLGHPGPGLQVASPRASASSSTSCRARRAPRPRTSRSSRVSSMPARPAEEVDDRRVRDGGRTDRAERGLRPDARRVGSEGLHDRRRSMLSTVRRPSRIFSRPGSAPTPSTCTTASACSRTPRRSTISVPRCSARARRPPGPSPTKGC